METTTTTRKVYRYGDGQGPEWAEFINVMHSGEEIEIDAEMFDYFLEVLPPVFMNAAVKIDGQLRRVDFGFAEGREYVVYFYTTPSEGRFFCRRSNVMNPDA